MTRSVEAQGFTLVELLMVIAIIATLAGMAMPMVSIARQSAKKANTSSTLRKLDTAIKLFKADVGAYPYGAAPALDTGPWGNDLAFRLMHVPTTAESALLRTQLAEVCTVYASGGSQAFPVDPTVIDQPRNVFSLAGKKIWDDNGNGVYDPGEVGMLGGVVVSLNRMARERANVAVMAGHAGVLGVAQNGGNPWIVGSAVLSAIAPASRTRGFTGDYLLGQLEPGQFTLNAGVPESVLDAYGHPIVYLRHKTNGVRGHVNQYCTGVIDANWFGLAPESRITTVSLNSDIRTHAGQAYVFDGEIWSAGPDGQFTAMRGDVGNRDNIPASAYLRGMQ